MISLNEWLKLYFEIANTMGYDISKDRLATKILSNYLKLYEAIYPSRILNFMINGRDVIVFGAGPTLEEGVRKVIEYKLVNKCVLIAANGATQALIENNLYPDLIVTDLDGNINYILQAIKHGSIPIIHGHGDNIDKLNKYIPEILKINKFIVGTTQVEPIEPVKNFGGFTDGDRAVFLATHFKAKRIFMIGMDFGDIVGKYSKPNYKYNVKANKTKLKKLNFAYKLISWLTKKTNSKIYSTSKIIPDGVIKINYKNLKTILK